MKELRRPLVAALAVFIFGLSFALRFAPPLYLPLLIAIAGVAGAGLLRGRRNSSLGQQLSILALFTASGLLLGTLSRRGVEADCRVLLDDGTRVEARGSLGASHRQQAANARVPLLPLLHSTVEGVPGCTGEFRVRLPADAPDLPPGATLQISGEWRSFSNPVSPSPWPRAPLYRGFLRADSVRVLAAAPTARSPLMLIRMRADEVFARLFPDHHAMVEALLLGRREYVDPVVTEQFAASGLTHLLAISGAHVGLFAAALLLLGGAARLPRRVSIYATLVVTWIYLLVIGAPASALRAGCMITVALASLLMQRISSAGPVMSIAAFVILALRPLSILDPGFQLSFLGVMGILWLRTPLLSLAPAAFQPKGWRRALVDSVVIGIGAFFATAPVVAHHFGIIAPISIIAGVPAIPLTSLALVGTAAALAIEPISFPMAALLADGAALALDLLGSIARYSATLPWGHAPVPPPPWWSWGVSGAAYIVVARSSLGRSKRTGRILSIGSAALVLVVWPLGDRATAKGLEVHFLDVGQGDAIAIRTPRDRWILVDAGPASRDFNAGERRVLPFLRERRVRSLEFLVLTHPHLDHIGGAVPLLNALDVPYLIEPGAAIGGTPYLEILRSLEGSETSWSAARSGTSLTVDGVRFDFLWPDSQTVDAVEDPNQISVVVRVSYGEFSLMLTGDAEAEVEAILLARHGAALRSDILKLGHHGSATSSTGPFLDAVDPVLAIVSAGRRNGYGHPSSTVLSALAARDIQVARTDREGTVTLTVARGGDRWARREW